MTRAPRPCRPSYRDPDLSNQWLREAEHRARREPGWPDAARKITLRLIEELRRLNKETQR